MVDTATRDFKIGQWHHAQYVTAQGTQSRMQAARQTWHRNLSGRDLPPMSFRPGAHLEMLVRLRLPLPHLRGRVAAVRRVGKGPPSRHACSTCGTLPAAGSVAHTDSAHGECDALQACRRLWSWMAAYVRSVRARLFAAQLALRPVRRHLRRAPGRLCRVLGRRQRRRLPLRAPRHVLRGAPSRLRRRLGCSRLLRLRGRQAHFAFRTPIDFTTLLGTAFTSALLCLTQTWRRASQTPSTLLSPTRPSPSPWTMGRTILPGSHIRRPSCSAGASHHAWPA